MLAIVIIMRYAPFAIACLCAIIEFQRVSPAFKIDIQHRGAVRSNFTFIVGGILFIFKAFAYLS